MLADSSRASPSLTFYLSGRDATRMRELDKSAPKRISPGHLRSQNYTYPSLSRGRISVTFMGTESGIARLTRVNGSKELSVWLLNRLRRSGRSRSACHGNRRSQVSFRGKMSGGYKLQQNGKVGVPLTVKEQNGFICSSTDMSRLIFTRFSALLADSPPDIAPPAASWYLSCIVEVSSRSSRDPQTGNAGRIEVDAS